MKAHAVNAAITDPQTGKPGLSVLKCVSGELYRVSRYHSGDFVGRFLMTCGVSHGEFEVIEHADPERIGTRLEVPHSLALIKPLRDCEQCKGTGKVWRSFVAEIECPDCGGTGALKQ